MAVYKVIQDVEAEDRLLGPLTLKGLIYAMIVGVLGFIEVRLAIAGSLGSIRWPIMIILFPPMLLFGVLAAPLSREQPTEVWLLSHIAFLIKSKKLIWNQLGQKELVTITAPKKVEKQLTKGFSQMEVRSRLQALATTMDSHGWVVRNVGLNMDTNPTYFQQNAVSDRLVAPAAIATAGPVVDIHAQDDILDEANNPRAQRVNELMQEADAERRKAIQEKINAARQNGTEPGPGDKIQIDTPKKETHRKKMPDNMDELGRKLSEIGDPEMRNKHPHFKTKLSRAQEQLEQQRQSAMTAKRQADKINLAQSGDAFSVATVAKMVNRHEGPIEQISPNEVVISLH